MAKIKENIIISWLVWHFYEMPKFLLYVWQNYLSFMLYFFSVPLLLSTLISPWRRYQWQYPKNFDIGGFFSTLVSNIFSRLIGFVARIVIIVFGIFAVVFVFIAGFLVVLFWVVLPLVLLELISLFLYGV